MTDPHRGRDGPQGPDGRQGLDGREGESGTQGPPGESMPGVRGERGREGQVGRAGPLGIGMFIVLIIYITGFGWSGEYHSCQRSNGTREAVRTFSSTAFQARTAAAQLDRERQNWKAYRVDHGAAVRYALSIKQAGALDCFGWVPQAKSK